MDGHKRLYPAIALILIIFISAAPGFAKTYKWKDQTGSIHYSQTPPDGYEVQEVTVQGSKSKSAQDAADSAEKSGAENGVGTESPENEKLAAMRKENCLNAKHTLMVLENNSRVRIKEGEDYRVIDAAEQKSRIDKLSTQIKELCQ